MTTYTISFDHSQCSYGQPVLLDQAGQPHGAADVGLHDLDGSLCGRVDVPDRFETRVYWSGYGDQPNRMWDALVAAARATGLTTVKVFDSSRVSLIDTQ